MHIKLGQCFLIKINKIIQILKFLKIKNNDIWIEIGSGYGVLTNYLVKKSYKVYIIELDKYLFNYLNENFYYFKNKYLYNQDILNVFIEKIYFLNKRRKIRIIGNLPYYISKKILFYFLKNKRYLQNINIMLQYEVIKQIFLIKNNKNFLSNIYKYYFNIIFILDFENNCFFPIPNVKSIFIVIELYIINPFLY